MKVCRPVYVPIQSVFIEQIKKVFSFVSSLVTTSEEKLLLVISWSVLGNSSCLLLQDERSLCALVFTSKVLCCLPMKVFFSKQQRTLVT